MSACWLAALRGWQGVTLGDMQPGAPNTVDLFCGAGGLSQGFRSAGFRCLFANDSEAPALSTYRANHPGTQTSGQDIRALDPEQLRAALSLAPGALDVLIGGPPCQGFSTYGARDPDDHRNRLYVPYLSFVEALRPAVVVIENVRGLLSMEGGRVISDILERLDRLGYSTAHGLLDAADYGVPQHRRRVFIVAGRDRAPVSLPPPTQQRLTVADAISDLVQEPLPPRQTHTPLDYAGPPQTRYQAQLRGECARLTHHASKQMLGIRRFRLALLRPGDYGSQLCARLESTGLPEALVDELLYGAAHRRAVSKCRRQDREREAELRALLLSGRVSRERLEAFLRAGGFANKYRRLRWDAPSHTLVAHMARDCTDFVHPDRDRFISAREAARLQSFPDAYRFEGSHFRQLRQIGNAVPPRLGAAIAAHVRTLL